MISSCLLFFIYFSPIHNYVVSIYTNVFILKKCDFHEIIVYENRFLNICFFSFTCLFHGKVGNYVYFLNRKSVRLTLKKHKIDINY